MVCIVFCVPIDVLMRALCSDPDRVRLMRTCKRLYVHRVHFAVEWQLEHMFAAFTHDKGSVYAPHMMALGQRLHTMGVLHKFAQCFWLASGGVRSLDPVGGHHRKVLSALDRVIEWTIDQDETQTLPHQLRRMVLQMRQAKSESYIRPHCGVWLLRRAVCSANLTAVVQLIGHLGDDFVFSKLELRRILRLAATCIPMPQNQRFLWVLMQEAFRLQTLLWHLELLFNVVGDLPTYEHSVAMLQTFLSVVEPNVDCLYQLLTRYRLRNVALYRRCIDEYATSRAFPLDFWFSWYLISHRTHLACKILRREGVERLPNQVVLEQLRKCVQDQSSLYQVLCARDLSAHAFELVHHYAHHDRFDATATIRLYAHHLTVDETHRLLQTFRNPHTVQILQEHLERLRESP